MAKHGLKFWDKAFGWKRRAEARATLDHVADYLEPGSSALDIGCGTGYLIDVLARDFQCEAFGCDVVTPPVEIEHFSLFDGFALPYRDKSVDVAFLVFVLHHAEDPGVLLHEASRVARKAVIVIEDTPRTAAEHNWGRMHIHSFGKRHNIPWRGRVRSSDEWRQIFHFTNTPLLHEERLGRFERLPPVSRSAFVLGAAPLPAAAQAQIEARSATATS
jgi:ubiquinone/menaquinone biosynthesis C-methylase UbiE